MAKRKRKAKHHGDIRGTYPTSLSWNPFKSARERKAARKAKRGKK